MAANEALSLYRRIFRLHRQKLPFHLRQLGDSYVRLVHSYVISQLREMTSRITAIVCREEFRRHKKAEAKWLESFFTEWKSYADMLQQQSPVAGSLGAPLPKDAVKSMTDEQKVQLLKLKEEAAKPYMDG